MVLFPVFHFGPPIARPSALVDCLCMGVFHTVMFVHVLKWKWNAFGSSFFVFVVHVLLSRRFDFRLGSLPKCTSIRHSLVHDVANSCLGFMPRCSMEGFFPCDIRSANVVVLLGAQLARFLPLHLLPALQQWMVCSLQFQIRYIS